MEEFKALLDAGTITQEQYDRFAAMHAENAQLRAKAIAGNDLRLKVSDKGAVSVYGLGRFPVTLYKSQMLRFLSHGKAIIEFIKANDERLKVKETA